MNSKDNLLNNMYFHNLDVYDYKSRVITDKTPHNFRWIGFIKIFFPNAKVILCKRNVKDNFLSIYKNYFASKKHMSWSFNPNNIVQYFKMYSDLVSFWKKKYTNFIYELNYDNLVINKDDEIRKLIKFCDLPWDNNCLNHYKNKKTVINTVSIYQARKPIYSSSSNLSNFYSESLYEYFKEL